MFQLWRNKLVERGAIQSPSETITTCEIVQPLVCDLNATPLETRSRKSHCFPAKQVNDKKVSAMKCRRIPPFMVTNFFSIMLQLFVHY